MALEGEQEFLIFQRYANVALLAAVPFLQLLS